MNKLVQTIIDSRKIKLFAEDARGDARMQQIVDRLRLINSGAIVINPTISTRWDNNAATMVLEIQIKQNHEWLPSALEKAFADNDLLITPLKPTLQ